jgi:dTDP-6-deoxy-L-talose 4-dehydrogenase (NAD+)
MCGIWAYISKHKKDYYEYFKLPTSLIHLAWEGLPNYKSDFHLTENLPKHQLFLSNLIRNGLKDITAIGTCFEYGMQEGMLSEAIECKPDNAYAKAKNELRVFLENIAATSSISFKWVRLFYMYGKGQNPKSLIAQLDVALENNDAIFNMSGGEQIRDFLPIEKVAENIATIALQNETTGLINCCSGEPIMVKKFVENYLAAKCETIKLNLGYYPYTDFEPMKFWGDTKKMNKIIKNTITNAG